MTTHDTVNTQPDLVRFGDQLEAAAERSLGGGRRRRLGRIAAGVTVITLIAAGTAVAAGIISPHEVASGLPAGTLIFGGTHPTCTLDGDNVTYHCALATAPSGGIGDYRGSKQLVALDLKIAGGCIGQDAAGLAWDCWMGKDAVRREILAEDLLGQPELEPGQG